MQQHEKSCKQHLKFSWIKTLIFRTNVRFFVYRWDEFCICSVLWCQHWFWLWYLLSYFVYGLFFSGHLAPVSLHLFIHSLHINKISLKYEHALRNGIYSKKECYQQMDQYCKWKIISFCRNKHSKLLCLCFFLSTITYIWPLLGVLAVISTHV